MKNTFSVQGVLVSVFSLASLTALQGVPITFSAAGSNPASIQPAVDAFRSALGGLNANIPGSSGDGRREINWDGVPQAFSSPNAFPANFFNGNTPGRARGAVFATAGSEFRVSANAGEGPVEFAEIDPAYPTFFAPFSPQKLFTPVGSTITDVTFFIPGSNVPAVTDGFGAVFSDVDLANVTSLQFYDANGGSLGTYFVPSSTGLETFSFLGVSFADAVVGRVRINSGNQALGPGNVSGDLVVMDDFIYGEPRRVPDGGDTLVFVAMTLCGVAALGRTGFRKMVAGQESV